MKFTGAYFSVWNNDAMKQTATFSFENGDTLNMHDCFSDETMRKIKKESEAFILARSTGLSREPVVNNVYRTACIILCVLLIAVCVAALRLT